MDFRKTVFHRGSGVVINCNREIKWLSKAHSPVIEILTLKLERHFLNFSRKLEYLSFDGAVAAFRVGDILVKLLSLLK
jgi:hypothetical protein